MNRKNKEQPSLHLSLKASLILLILGSFAVCGIMFFLSPGSLMAFLLTCLKHPDLFLWNWLPLILIEFLLWFISGNALFSLTAPGLVFVFGAAVNRIKVLFRQDPLLPSDITLFRESISIIDGMIPHRELVLTALVIFMLFALLAPLFFVKSKALKPKLRLAGGVLTAAALVILNTEVYANERLYASYAVEGNTYFNANHYISKGFLYSFIKDVNSGRVEKPEGYDKAYYAQQEEGFATKESHDKTPHIVMIMGEAFTDIPAYEAFVFAEGKDPLAAYKSITAQEDTVSGHIVVPRFGGGTCNTEFDVLTACATRLTGGNRDSYEYVRGEMEALPALLKEAGYDNLAIHPGYSWFYNRANVYEYFGFDAFYHLESSFDPESQNKGGYISDEATADTVISTFEEHLQSSDAPLFSFTVTIQNHGPYNEKYEGGGLPFETDAALTAEERAILEGYFKGVADTDALLGRLTDYFDAVDEPVVLVFFGDHLPGFSGVMELFGKLGLPINLEGSAQEQLNAYSTPFFLWQNEAAREQNILQGKDLLPENGTISSNYLGSLAMEALGFDSLSPFLAFTAETMAQLPVIMENLCITEDGEITAELSTEEKELTDTLRGWTYYQMFE